MKSFRRIALAAGLAAAGLAVPATGQVGSRAEKQDGETEEAESGRRGGVQGAQGKEEKKAGGEQRTGGASERQGGGAERPANQGGANEPAADPSKRQGGGAERPANQGGANEPAADPNKRLSREEAVELLRRLQQEENLHRKHLARLERLKELSRNGNDEARAKEVADLLAKEMARHERALAQLERQVGPENFRRGKQKLIEAARQKRTEGAAGKGNDRGKEQEKEKERPKENGERKGDAGSRGEGNQRGGGR